MKTTRYLSALACFWFLLFSAKSPAAPQHYTIRSAPGKAVQVVNGKTSFRFSGDFLVLYTPKDPKMILRYIPKTSYFAPTWQTDTPAPGKGIEGRKVSAATGGDGVDNTLAESAPDRSFNIFSVAETTLFSPAEMHNAGDSVIYTYAEHPVGRMRCVVSCPDGGNPVMRFTFTPSRDGYYSVIYTGAPAFDASELDALWQPMIWQRKIFPTQSFVSLAFMCSMPACMVEIKGKSMGVAAHPEEFPYQPLPSRNNNRFGVLLRDASGKARPMLTAPVLGHEGSKMAAGAPFSFRICLVAENRQVDYAYETVARNLYGFHDYRSNAITTLNNTIDNLIDYTLSEYGCFLDSLKGYSYSTDVPGSVKNVSSLNPLSVAMIADDPEVYERRAYPIMEYMLSREKTLFCLDTTQKVQGPSRKMTGPCALISELAALYKLSDGKCDILRRIAEEKYYKGKPVEKRTNGFGGAWYDALEMYRATGEEKYLSAAIKGAAAYVARTIDDTPTKYTHAFFWTSFAPRYVNLLEMYRTTRDKRYLEAARFGARQYAMFVFMAPTIPDTTILVNKGGLVPFYYYRRNRGIPQQQCPEETVPAWRLSEIGLVPESSSTSIGHRAVFMAHHAPYMMEIAILTGDRFLHDIARSAVVGRYRNFPGYHINTERSSAYEKFDFPLRPFNRISASSFHYNHQYPLISVLYGYAVTDAESRSNGKIAFDCDYIEGYGYLQARFYGNKPGRFYDCKQAWLWMPRRLLRTSHIELNYISARSENDRLMVAFTNQSSEHVHSHITFNPELLPEMQGRSYKAEIWKQNKKSGECSITDGQTDVEVSPHGITALVIRDIEVSPRFQHKMASGANTVWKHDYYQSPFGHTKALVLNMGQELKTAFVYLQDDDSSFREVSLSYKIDNEKFQNMSDTSFPFEFTVPLHADSRQVVFQITGIAPDGTVHKGKPFKLSRD